MSSCILINGEERITIKLIMDNNCNKLHVVSLSKVNENVQQKKYQQNNSSSSSLEEEFQEQVSVNKSPDIFSL